MKATLATTGRTSGQPRETPLNAFADGDRLVIVGSNDGSPNDPAWVANLRNEARATIRLGREVRQVRAVEVRGSERDRLWQLVCNEMPEYASYQQQTTRMIPLFVLEPFTDRAD